MTRQRWLVQGVVQGVGFRWWTAARAEALGLRGWCRNLPDGSVEVEAEGSAAAMTAFERVLGEGPPHARVTSCIRRDAGPDALSPGFSIRH